MDIEISENSFRDCLAVISNPHPPVDFIDNLQKAIKTLGFKYFSFGFGYGPIDEPVSHNLFLFSNYEKEFWDIYNDDHMADFDLGVDHSRNNPTPIYWHELDAPVWSGDKNTEEYRVVEIAAKYGVRYGITIPAIYRRSIFFGLSLVVDIRVGGEKLKTHVEKYWSLIWELFNAVHHACPVGYLVKMETRLSDIELMILNDKAKGIKNAQIYAKIKDILNDKSYPEEVRNSFKLPKTEKAFGRRVSALYSKLFRNDLRGDPSDPDNRRVLNPKKERLLTTLIKFELFQD